MKKQKQNLICSLNPYSNGYCSMRVPNFTGQIRCLRGLNPYSNGYCSMSYI